MSDLYGPPHPHADPTVDRLGPPRPLDGWPVSFVEAVRGAVEEEDPAVVVALDHVLSSDLDKRGDPAYRGEASDFALVVLHLADVAENEPDHRSLALRLQRNLLSFIYLRLSALEEIEHEVEEKEEALRVSSR